MVLRYVVPLAACALGYGGRIVVERLQQRRRERVLHALGGQLPEWEQNARALEAKAQEMALIHSDYLADTLRQQADVTRKRGRRRDRQWR